MTNTPSKKARGLDQIDKAHRFAVTAPDVFWPHTSPGREYGTPDGVPVRYVQGDIVTRADLPVDDVAVRTMLAHGLIEDAPDVVAPTTHIGSDDVDADTED